MCHEAPSVLPFFRSSVLPFFRSSVLPFFCVLLTLLSASALAEDNYLTVKGIAGYENTQFSSFEEAYNTLKPVLATLGGLGQEPASNEAFDALFTDVDADGHATLTYTIYGNLTYDESTCPQLLSMGRAASHYSTSRHLIKFKLVGGKPNRASTLTVNSTVTLPYEWWGEKPVSSISFDNLTLNSTKDTKLWVYSAQNGCLEAIQSTIQNCTFQEIGLYHYNNVPGTVTVVNNTFIGNQTRATGVHIQGSPTDPLTINISGNSFTGYVNGAINIDQNTATAAVTNNTIDSAKNAKFGVQIARVKTIDISGNTIDLDGGNAFKLYDSLRETHSTIAIKSNTITGSGYLLQDDAAAKGNSLNADNLTLNLAGNTITATVDTTKGLNKDGTTQPLNDYLKAAVAKGTSVPPTPAPAAPAKTAPRTGDSFNAPLYAALLLISVAAAALMLKKRISAR